MPGDQRVLGNAIDECCSLVEDPGLTSFEATTVFVIGLNRSDLSDLLHEVTTFQEGDLDLPYLFNEFIKNPFSRFLAAIGLMRFLNRRRNLLATPTSN